MRNWLESKTLSIRPLTASGYRGTAERDILPFLGKMHLQQILPAHIDQLYARLKEEGRGARMIDLPQYLVPDFMLVEAAGPYPATRLVMLGTNVGCSEIRPTRDLALILVILLPKHVGKF